MKPESIMIVSAAKLKAYQKFVCAEMVRRYVYYESLWFVIFEDAGIEWQSLHPISFDDFIEKQIIEEHILKLFIRLACFNIIC